MNLCVCVCVCVCVQACLMKISELAEPGQDQNVEEDWGAQQAEKKMLSAWSVHTNTHRHTHTHTHTNILTHTSLLSVVASASTVCVARSML